MKRTVTLTVAFLLAVFIAPALLHLAVWAATEKPTSWRTADWSSAGTLPKRLPERDAIIHVMSARTGGLKGAFATHSWLLLKKPGSRTFDRYDVVGWGRPVRKNAYAPDGKWYSNPPRIDATISGKDAERQLKSFEELDNNLAAQAAAMKKLLNFEEGSNKAIIVNNLDFYKNMNVLSFLRDVGKTVTINYMTSKESVKRRIEAGLSFSEFSYQLLQAYDFQCLFQEKA